MIRSGMETATGSEEKWFNYPWSFYFDPSTIVITEMTVEGMQTTIKQISKDTDYFANNGWSNGLTEHAWFVLGSFLLYRLNE